MPLDENEQKKDRPPETYHGIKNVGWAPDVAIPMCYSQLTASGGFDIVVSEVVWIGTSSFLKDTHFLGVLQP
jgi:hypothetical protein